MGYNVACSAVGLSRAEGAQGGVGLVSQARPNGWGIECTRFQRQNVVGCKIVTRHTRTPLVGAYLPPSTLGHLSDIEVAPQIFKGLYPIVPEDLNLDLVNF